MGYNTPKQTVSQFQLKGRYARQYLSFAGKSSKDFLLYLSAAPFRGSIQVSSNLINPGISE